MTTCRRSRSTSSRWADRSTLAAASKSGSRTALVAPIPVPLHGREKPDRDRGRFPIVEALPHLERAPRPEVHEVAGDRATEPALRVGPGFIACVPAPGTTR